MKTTRLANVGRVTVVNGVAKVPVFFRNDANTEGTETFVFKLLASPSYKLAANLSTNVTILDTSTNRSYILTTTPSLPNVGEGESYIINIYSTDLEDGIYLAWLIDGVDAFDLSTPLSGNALVNNNYANVRVTTVKDRKTEGDETIYFRLLPNADPNVTIDAFVWSNILLLDNSRNSVITVSSNVLNVDEGNCIEFTIQTSNVYDGYVFNYGIEGISQSDLAVGNTIGKLIHRAYNNELNGNANLVVRLAKDVVTEGNEVIRFFIYPDTNINLNQYLYANVNVADTSQPPTFSLAANVSQVQEGQSVKFTVTTGYLDNNTVLSYVVEGISASDIANGASQLSGEIRNISLNGGISGSAEKSFLFTRDKTTEGTENLTFKILSDPGILLFSNLVAAVEIFDLSKYPRIALTANRSSVSENSVVQFTVESTELDAGTILPYSISNMADVNSHISVATYTVSAGLMNIASDGRANIIVNMKEDFTTEGEEFLTLTVPANATYNTDGVSASIPIVDSSLTPSLSFSAGPDQVNEGDALTITVTGTNVPNNTSLSWSITNNPADVTPNSGSIIMILDPAWPASANTIALIPVADSLTEGPETVTLTTGAVASINLASFSVNLNIRDTSLSIPAPPTPAPPFPEVYSCSSSTILSDIGSRGPGWNIIDIDCGIYTGDLTIVLDFKNNYDYASLQWGTSSVNTGIAIGQKTLTISKTAAYPSSIRLQVNPNNITVANPAQYTNGEYNVGGWWEGSGWNLVSISCPGNNPPAEISCASTFTDGDIFGVIDIVNNVGYVTGSLTGGNVWGNSLIGYTDDSDFRRAAVHAGLVSAGNLARIRLVPVGRKTGILGTTANGITTSSWNGDPWCSIKLEAYNEPDYYSVFVNNTSISEGQSVTYTVITNSLPGTILYYELSGISSSDTPNSLTGTTVVPSSGNSTISITLNADGITEGTETLQFKLYSGGYSSSGGTLRATAANVSIQDL